MKVTIPQSCKSFANEANAEAAITKRLGVDTVASKVKYMLIPQFGRVYPMLLPSEAQLNSVMFSGFYIFRA
jgi:hypothetical protein